MKKIFIALSALAALVLGVVPAQALPGIPDRVHGAEVLAPFWVVSYDGTLDTLISSMIGRPSKGMTRIGHIHQMMLKLGR